MAFTSLSTDIDKYTRQLTPKPTAMVAELKTDNSIKAVLFDIYGTLLISAAGDVGTTIEDHKSTTFSEVLKILGISEIPTFEKPFSQFLKETILRDHKIKQVIHGIESPEVDIREIWWDLIEKLNLPIPLETDSVLCRLALLFELISNPVYPMPSAVTVLKDLQKRQIQTGIVSNAQFYTPIILQHFIGYDLYDSLFEDRFCSWSYLNKCSKPSPSVFYPPIKELAKSHAIEPKEILYVGNDMLNDVWTAKQNGLKTALFAGDQRSLRLRDNDVRCNSLKPDFVITELKQLTTILKE